MKIYVAADMEGCSGVVHTEQTDPRGHDYALARRWMAGDVNAAVAGAFEGGATAVVVSDGHGANGFRNLLLHDLDPRAELITGGPRPHGQLEGLDGTFDAVFLIGFHARHGSAGVLSHTTNGQAVANLWLEGQAVGEVGLNAYMAGHFGVPVVLVSGDDLTVAEARELLPHVEGVAVKRALGRYSARCIHPARAQAALRAAAGSVAPRAAAARPVSMPGPVEVTVQFKDTGGAESARRMPGVEPVGDDTVRVRCPDMPAAYRTYATLTALWPAAWGNWVRG